MKTKAIIYLFLLLLIISCSQMKKVTNAFLYNYNVGITIQLNDKQIGQLKDLIENGLELTDGRKWVYLRTIEINYDEKKDENLIDLFEGDFDYYIKIKNKYYKVEEPYKHILIDFIKVSKGY
jgi:hypothetical protein